MILFNTLQSVGDFAVACVSSTPKLVYNIPTVPCRSQGKEQCGRDSGRHRARKAPERDIQLTRSSGERRHKQDNHRRDRRDELTNAEKSRMERFGAGKAV